jgi:uncharacterized protein YdaU (DUF1376 family)
MAEFPALPLFTDAYLADTRHLSAEEHGAYLLLLMCAWRTRGCALRDDDRFLARIAGVSPQKWRRLKPVLRDFFEVEDGLWRQKKLTDVYRGVETRVAKNRANGAKGGLAKARKARGERQQPGGGDTLPAKTKHQKPKPEPKPGAVSEIETPLETEAASGNKPGDRVGLGCASKPEGGAPTGGDAAAAQSAQDLRQIAQAAGLPRDSLDASVVSGWAAAGAQLAQDILPTIRRLYVRQAAKGEAPASLAYFGAAILQARDKRLRAVRSGRKHAADNPPAPVRRAFDPGCAADWRSFLGDPKSRFRGDYMSANWAIRRDHPVFQARSLGTDPRVAPNPLIPAAIYKPYGPAWGWRSCPGIGCGQDVDNASIAKQRAPQKAKKTVPQAVTEPATEKEEPQ